MDQRGLGPCGKARGPSGERPLQVAAAAAADLKDAPLQEPSRLLPIYVLAFAAKQGLEAKRIFTDPNLLQSPI